MKAIKKEVIKPTDFFRCECGVGMFVQTGADIYQTVVFERTMVNRLNDERVFIGNHKKFSYEELKIMFYDINLEDVEIISTGEFLDAVRKIRT